MRWCGKVGYIQTVQTAPGVYSSDTIVERPYKGDVIKRSSSWENSGSLNDNINITNEISIVADPYAYSNFSHIRYVELFGVKWKVTRVEIQRPRLVLTVGGEYNGQ